MPALPTFPVKALITRKSLTWLAAVLLVLAAVTVGLTLKRHSRAAGPVAPSSPTAVCGTSILNSPYSYNGTPGTFTTSGTPGLPTFGEPGTDFPTMTKILVIPAGNNNVDASTGVYEGVKEIFYFEPGTHRIKGMYSGHDSVYIGGYTPAAGRAIIDGVNGGAGAHGLGGSSLANSRPSSGNNVYDTWEYLTIKNFASSENNAVMGNVNGGSSDVGDTYMYNTIGPNEYGYAGNTVAPATGQNSGGGYGIDMGSNTTVRYNCFDHNAQGAFNGGGVNINISHNEIAWNGLGEYPDNGNNPKSCGCSGGGKLFNSINPVIDYNYVHDNYNTGIWLDFDNTGADISFNYIASNWGGGIGYEASYNANISYNTLVGNGWASNGAWPSGGAYTCYGGVSCTNGLGPITGNGGFPYAAISLSNSGANSNLSAIAIPALIAVAGCSSRCTVTSRYVGQMLVEGNVLTNNFGGVMVYTDTDRYPNNIDNDSACSVPLGAGAIQQQSNSTTYYQQTKVLQTGYDSTVSGRTVTSSGGTKTFCGDYGDTQANATDAGQDIHVRAPSVGMAVYDMGAGTFLGNIASVTSAKSFTLTGSPGNRTGARLMVSAYGGCGPADYFGGGPGVKSGQPAALYWDNCIWGGRGTTVSGNAFSMTASAITGCNAANMCGYQANVAFNAAVPKLMQFFNQYANRTAHASGGLGNVWSNNTYTWGDTTNPWQFWAGDQGNIVTLAQWRAAPNGQDAGSIFNTTPSATATRTPTPSTTPSPRAKSAT